MFTFSPEGLELLKSLEGYRGISYRDEGGIWTIGYGHTKGIAEGESVTYLKAEQFLLADIAHAEEAVQDILGDGDEGSPALTNNQYSALVIFVYNIGAGAFEHSTLAAYLLELEANAPLAKEEIDYTLSQLKRWKKVHNKVSVGLVHRREKEIALFLTPDQEVLDF